MRLPTLALLACALPAAAQPGYVRKGTRDDTIRATLRSAGLHDLGGTWHYAGPFDNRDRAGFDTAYPPETGIDRAATYTGKNGRQFGWKELPKFATGRVYDLLPLFPGADRNAVVYLLHEFEGAADRYRLPVSLGADDTLSVWFNGDRLVHEDHERAAASDQFGTLLKVRPGKNQLLLKVCQYGGGWEVYVGPELPDTLPAAVHARLAKDFPKTTITAGSSTAADDEAKAYRVTTLAPPAGCVLEVGGLAFRPDGKLFVCTRRGEIWLAHNPGAANPADVRFTRFAAGLHEALGMHVADNNTVYVIQRPELTKVTDTDGDGTADEFRTVSAGWGVSGDYHEYAFGPARDTAGNFFVTLNVGFGGGHQAKVPWRGWCVKVAPDGSMVPWAYGLRSPNGVAFSPDGDLFYCDNQGEWVATNKLHHIRRGQFYGHQAGLRWVKGSPFAGKVPETVKSGMLYDGQPGPGGGAGGRPAVDPPAIWFPYGRMGQSVSEPRWDTTAGRFGPFAGQCFVGDQTRSSVMRVALEKVNGVYQGACFPFRSGLQCGVNRLAFGPDGALYVGQTNRGWGSIGGKPYGLQRLAFTGAVPFEVHSVALTEDGFDLRFTQPFDANTVGGKGTFSVKSFTYIYHSTYGSPEVDARAEKVTSVGALLDGNLVRLGVSGLKPGRVYEIRLDGVRSRGGEPVLHPEAYYTLNELVK